MTRAKPEVLAPGSVLGVVAPAGPVDERSRLLRGVAALEGLGFRVELGAHVLDRDGHLAGRDRDRAEDLLTMLERPDVDAVMCLRGGDGTMRTALALDLPRLRRLRAAPPKPFVGFSDITVLHAVLARELGWTTFYGPMVGMLARATDYTIAGFRRALMTAEPFEVPPDPADPYVETVVPGRAQGPLVGGCLALVAQLVGTPWQLELDGAVFFFEDVNEPPPRIERYLGQLLAAGALQRCAGVLIGELVACGPSGNSLGLERVFDDLLVPLGVPVLSHLPVGHGASIATLPLGVHVELDASAQRLVIQEPGVAEPGVARLRSSQPTP